MNNETTVGNGRTLAGLLNEVKEELKEFLDTRLQMLKAEMKQKIAMLRMVVPMLLVAALLGAIGCLLLTIALVAAIASLIGWGWSFLAVGVLYLLVAGATAAFALREIKAEGVAPTRTIKVLKQDQLWLQNEARSQL
jgi:ABC-type multidrug transport system permease subunit